MAISSQFHRDLSKVENKILRISKRKLMAYTLLGLALIPLSLEVFFLPTWLFYVVVFPTGIVLGGYPFLLLTNKWKTTRRRIELYFMEEDSYYQTGQIRRYESFEFTQQASVKETDNIN
ncbi:MAG TPA: PrgI family protein [Lactovum miscens]